MRRCECEPKIRSTRVAVPLDLLRLPVAPLAHAFRASGRLPWIDKTPKIKLFKEGSGRERSITVQQADALLGELPEHQREVVIFALATGLRQSNVLGLEWS